MSYQVSPASLPRLVPIRRLGLCASLVGVCRPMQRRADLQLVLTAALDTHHTAPALAKELPLSTQEPALDRALPRAHHDVAHPPPVPPIRSSNLQGGGGYAGGGYSRNGDGGNGNGVTQVCSAVRRMLQAHFLHLCFSYLDTPRCGQLTAMLFCAGTLRGVTCTGAAAPCLGHLHFASMGGPY